ncbi:hypothetical protein WME90_16835 [Sorangium sp. So ce375]|uniref:hypothetical protein n=1 Tax=Sorangium sp. So ce375 TaxID=3133306 RepID=UPI003F5B4AF6
MSRGRIERPARRAHPGAALARRCCARPAARSSTGRHERARFVLLSALFIICDGA